MFVMHAMGRVFCVHHPVELSVLRSRNPKLHALFKKMSLTAPSSGFEECHHHEFHFCHEEFWHDEDDEDEVCGRSPCCSVSTISILFSDQQRSHNLHFLRVADSEFDAFVCSDELVFRAALCLPYTRLVAADILLLLLHNLGVVVEVVEVLQHSAREPNVLNLVFVQLS